MRKCARHAGGRNIFENFLQRVRGEKTVKQEDCISFKYAYSAALKPLPAAEEFQ